MNLTDRVCEAFQQNPGATSYDLAVILNTHPAFVRTALRRRGFSLRLTRPGVPSCRTGRPRRYRKLQEWEEQAALDAFRDGEKLAAIAHEFGVDPSTISLIAKKNGLSRKHRPTEKLSKYRGIGFTVSLQEQIQAFARSRRIGFGEAVRVLICAALLESKAVA